MRETKVVNSFVIRYLPSEELFSFTYVFTDLDATGLAALLSIFFFLLCLRHAFYQREWRHSSSQGQSTVNDAVSDSQRDR